VAVAAFLEGRIGFTRIPELIAEALSHVPARPLGDVEACVAIDGETRRLVGEWLTDGHLTGSTAR